MENRSGCRSTAETPMSAALRKHDFDRILSLVQRYDAIPSELFDDDIAVQLLKHAKTEHSRAITKLIDSHFINVTAKSTFLAALDCAFRRTGSVELAKKILTHDRYSQVEQLYPESIYFSAKNNWPKILSKLLEKTVNINTLTEGQTPLSAACKAGHKCVVSLLLENGADPNVPNDFGTTPLHFAVSSGKTEFVRSLLSYGANPNIAAVLPHITWCWYPLHAACSDLRGSIRYEVVKLLLAYNADVNVRDEFGETALHYAVSLYSTGSDKTSDLVQLLVDAGADVNAPSEVRDTPLYNACSNGLESTVKKMLECGARVDGINGRKLPLSAACRNGHMSVVQLLLANGANPNPQGNANQYPYSGKPDESPLVEACLFQNVELVDMLLKHGADPNLTSPSSHLHSKYKYPLCVVVENVINSGYYQSTKEMRSKLSTVSLLLQHGANVNMPMPGGRSLMHLTVTALAKAGKWRREIEYRTCLVELLQLTVKHGAQLHDSCFDLGVDNHPRAAKSRTLLALANFDGEDKFVVDLFRAGAGFRLLAHCCIDVFSAGFPWEEKFTGLCQAAVLAGYVPSDGELEKLEKARDDILKYDSGTDGENASADRIQQLLNWLNEDRQQVPSLQRQCRVVIRRQLSAAARFQSILPAIDKLPLPTILKLYLQFDGPLSEFDLNVCIPTRS